MVARQSAALRSSVPLQGRSVLANFRKDRPSADRRMDFGGQAERPLSTSDAQIHLEPDATWSLKDARTTCAVIPSGAKDLTMVIGDAR